MEHVSALRYSLKKSNHTIARKVRLIEVIKYIKSKIRALCWRYLEILTTTKSFSLRRPVPSSRYKELISWWWWWWYAMVTHTLTGKMQWQLSKEAFYPFSLSMALPLYFFSATRETEVKHWFKKIHTVARNVKIVKNYLLFNLSPIIQYVKIDDNSIELKIFESPTTTNIKSSRRDSRHNVGCELSLVFK